MGCRAAWFGFAFLGFAGSTWRQLLQDGPSTQIGSCLVPGSLEQACYDM